ncbi:MAG: hypothetical protein WBP61_10760 [Nocardioides sp.]
MQITTTPHRPASTPWGRLVALVVILGPVSVLVLLPIGLGMQRYVMTSDSMAGDRDDSIPRGAVVFERLVPLSDLRVGDVVTFRPPPSERSDTRATRITHRIVEITPDGIRTQGDARPAPDPWLLDPDPPVLPRVDITIPYLGYAYLALASPLLWIVALSLTAFVVVLAAAGHRRAQVAPTAEIPVDVGTEP